MHWHQVDAPEQASIERRDISGHYVELENWDPGTIDENPFVRFLKDLTAEFPSNLVADLAEGYPKHAVKLLRSHWQKTLGEPDHSIRMKDAGKKAGVTRRRRAAARKAAKTRQSTS